MELKNCPFCGSDEVTIAALRGRRGWFVFAKCDFCGSQGKTYGHAKCSDNCYEDCSPDCIEFFECESVVKASKAWNRRVGECDG